MKAVVQSWQRNLAVISKNLLELSNGQKIQQIKFRIKDKARPYKGTTLEKTQFMVTTLDKLWQDYLLLTEVVDRAESLLKEDSFFHDTEKEVKELLEGTSIKLPSVHIPITNRTLLASAEENDVISPTELLKSMEVSFGKVQEIYKLLIDSEDLATQVGNGLSKDYEDIKNQANNLHVPLIINVETNIQMYDCDPIGCYLEFQNIFAQINFERNRLAAIQKEMEMVETSLESCGGRLVELRNILEQTTCTIEETKNKIAGPYSFPSQIAISSIISLEKWLETLRSTFKSGNWGPVKVGVSRWEATCKDLVLKAKECYIKCRESIEARDSLRSQFKALKARCESLATSSFEPSNTLIRLGEGADQALKAKPFKIEPAQRLISRYEETLAFEIDQYRRMSK